MEIEVKSNYCQQVQPTIGAVNMENNANYETVISGVRQLFTLMARTNTDKIEVRIAKEIFRWSSVVAGAAVVAVAVL
ncbi:hypothetical protein [Arthrobacter sp. Leaf141]|uniref:hypothetical protein n=1 Tax=Arthrobacter sp. Leaf141 TaxID=1736273 RepID=UPI0012FC0605|nr:hypothetical protein [Arthrobacter sp. Leaf141]